jgi:hypothetical protein
MFPHRVKSFLGLLCLIFLFTQEATAQYKNEEELKKEANKLFEDDEFTKAYSLYAQLVSNYPKDPEYNYRLGVCMLYSEPDKTKCFSYLKFAAGHPKDAPKDAKFYLGKAYHINYLFDEAIKCYNEYKTIGTASQLKKLQVDNEIRACQNGKRLLSSMSDLVVMNKKQLNEGDYFRSYDQSIIGGKLLVKPDVFKTATDKKKKDKSVVFVPKSGDKVFFSSYGENGNNGRDIYYANRLPNNEFGTPVRVIGVNTDFDEDYPFLHPDGKTLYFSSKGFNSMGGYDVFKSTFNPETNSWSLPVNLEFPINSPDDDYLFVTDSSEKIAFFSTGRQSPPGKIDVLKVNTERVPMEIAVIKGTVVKENAAQSLKSKITVKNLDNGQIVGVYHAQDNGDYYMELPNGGKFIYTVETPGLPTQSDKVAIPMATSLKPFKQTISYDQKVLKILNYFDSPPDDNSYLQYLSLIEKKAKLDVNEGQLKTPTIVGEEKGAVATNTNAVNTTNPTIVSEENGTNTTANNPKSNDPKKGMTNAQLVDIAKQDALEAETEAKKINQDARDAFEIAEQKNTEAIKLQKDAEDAMAGISAITDEVQKKEAEKRAIEIKREADNATAVAGTILNLAKDLEADAKVKEKEAELNKAYAKELESVTTNNNNKEALGKLSDLQKQLEEISAQKKKSEESYNAIKLENDKKQANVLALEEKSSQIRNEIDGIKKEISLNDTELKNTKDKSLKTNLTNQNTELNKDLAAKTTSLDQNEQELAKARAEAKAIQNEMELANTIKTTDSPTAIAKNTNTNDTASNSSTISTTNNSTAASNSSNNSSALNYDNVNAKYDAKISAITNTNDKAGIEETNKLLTDYNKEINDLIALEKVDLSAAATASEKKKINEEIKKLENQKKVNQDKITANNQKIKQLDGGSIVSNTNTTSSTNNSAANNSSNTANNTAAVNPVVTFDGKDDLNKLNELKDRVDKNSNPAFAFAGYKESSSITMKKEADDKLLAVNTSKTELDALISKAKEDVNNSAPVSADKAKDNLNAQADEIAGKAKDLRISARDKTGDEKEKLLTEAKALDKEANKKYLEATDVTKTVNTNEFSTNNENISALLNANTSSKEDINEAKKLDEEAKATFKQAQSIRGEASSQNSDAAKLGIVSNAEEKEAEALNKQRKAVELLMKANSGFALKTPDNTIKTNGSNENLNKVTQQFEKLNKDKIDAYMSFSKANQNEIKLQSAQLEQSGTLKNNTEALKYKTQADELNKEAVALIGRSLTEPDANNKQNLLMEANKKEVEAISALNKVNELLQQGNVASTSTNTTTTSDPQANNTNTNTDVATNNANRNNETNTSTNPTTDKNLTANNSATTTNNSTADPTNKAANANNNTTGNDNANTDNSVSANKNSNTANPVNNTGTPTNSITAYKNPEAGALKNNATVNLKTLEEEKAKVEQEIKSSPGTKRTEAEVKGTMTSLMNNADSLSKRASEIRKNAADKPEEEKKTLLAEARALDKKSVKTKLQVSDIQKDLNEAQYNSYNEGITSLMEKAKASNAPELAQARELMDLATNYKKQASNIREESQALPSDAAKLGGYSNAEEKEAEVFNKQLDVIGLLRKYDPEFVIKEPSVTIAGTPENASPELKQKYEELQQKEITEYDNITKANVMEYETSVAQLPVNLDPQQSADKASADRLISESKDLNSKASQTTDLKQKRDMLADAARKGDEAVATLNKINSSAVAKNNTPRNNANNGNTTPVRNNSTTTDNNSVANNNNNKPPRNNANTSGNENAGANNANTVAVKANGVEVKTVNAYSTANPIPIDQKIPDGLIFRVQIGAFKAPVPNDAFKGLAPVNGQTTPNGYIRYTAGNFETFADANAVKNDLNNLGYKDAFVVGYYNGKRITLTEAADILGKEGKPVDLAANTNQSAGITAKANIPRNTAVPATVNNDAAVNPVVVTKELEQVRGMLFTIQIGVYNRQISKSRLYNLTPIYTERLPSGLYRYTAGIYNRRDLLMEHKQKVIDLGIRDAFVSAYFNGKRITFAEADKLKADSANLQMEPENPIVFPTTVATNVTAVPVENNTATNPAGNVAPFSNGVTSSPAPTPENGVKVGEEGISYKVQIGAYRNQVPNETAAKFLNIKTWPIAYKQINGLFIYTAGNFVDAKSAKKLKDELVALGINDAYVTVYRDGKKLYGTEASGLLNR